LKKQDPQFGDLADCQTAPVSSENLPNLLNLRIVLPKICEACGFDKQEARMTLSQRLRDIDWIDVWLWVFLRRHHSGSRHRHYAQAFFGAGTAYDSSD
jgi:hypothetical protein